MSDTRKKWPNVAILLMILATLPSVLNAKQMAVSISGQSVTVRDASSGGGVVLYGVSFERPEPLRVPVRSITHRAESDLDRDTIVTFMFDAPVPPTSLWVAVDSDSGDYAVVLGSGSRPRILPLAGWLKSEGGKLKKGQVAGTRELEVFVLRPGVASWSGIVSDGGSEDADHRIDQSLVIDFERLTARAAGMPALEEVTKNDLVLLVDPRNFTVLTYRVKGDE